MSIDRTEVTDIHTLKDVLLLGEQALDAIIETDKALAATILHHAHLTEHTCQAVAPFVVAGRSGEVEQVTLESTHRTVDRHLVVVEYDEHVVIALRGIVESLEGKSTTHGTVTDDGHHAALVIALLLGCYSHTEGCRNRVGSMATGERVVFALFG